MEFTPSVTPSQGSKGGLEFTTQEVEFDGYRQLTPATINNCKRKLTLTWNNLDISQFAEIRTFFEAHNGNIPFGYTPPNGDRYEYVCSKFDWSYTEAGHHDCTATLEELVGGAGVASIDNIPGASMYAASQVSYDNGTSGLTATTVQAAIDEIANKSASLEIASYTTLGGVKIDASKGISIDASGYLYLTAAAAAIAWCQYFGIDGIRTYTAGSAYSALSGGISWAAAGVAYSKTSIFIVDDITSYTDGLNASFPATGDNESVSGFRDNLGVGYAYGSPFGAIFETSYNESTGSKTELTTSSPFSTDTWQSTGVAYEV